MTVSYTDLALRLREAYGGPAVSPLRDGLEPLDAEGAYAVQLLNTHHWVEQGRRIVGRKAGLTSKAVQRQLGVSQPDFGVLFGDMRIRDGGVLESASLIQPKAEAEIAFVLGSDLSGPKITTDIVAAAVSNVHAAIEIVDSRIADWKISFADTVADNGSSAFFILSEQSVLLKDLDLYSCGMVLELNGDIASIGVGAAVLGHPLHAATWLAQTMADSGQPLVTGDILLTGAMGPMVAITPGDHLRASIGGVGAVTFSYGPRQS